jgi:hypothetical protein
MTGTGKTNLAFQILGQLQEHRKPFLVFDWKGNYRALQQLDSFKQLKIIRPGDGECTFRFNPLIPPAGIDPKHWMTLLVDVIKHAFFVGHGVEYFLRRGIDKLYQNFGIYRGGKVYPTFSDLERLLLKEYARGREMLWMSSAKRVLSILTFSGVVGDVMDSRTQPEIERGPVVQAPQTIDEFGNVERDVAQPPEREYSWFDGLLGGLVDAINKLATAIGLSYRQTRLQSVQQRIDFLASEAGQLQESDPNRVRLIDEMSQLMQERDRLQSELEQGQLPESASLQRPTALTGTAMAKVSFDQSSKQPLTIAPIDNSTTASTTNINASKTVNAFSTNARNNEMRGKYTYA